MLKVRKVYQFMAQKDAKVNIRLAENSATIAKASLEDSAAMRVLAAASRDDSAAMRTIAAESKKDSSAMKTLSILGMFFLPGTFVAVSLPHPNVVPYEVAWTLKSKGSKYSTQTVVNH